MTEVKVRRGKFQVSERAAREVRATQKRKPYRIPKSWWDEDVAANMAAYIKRSQELANGND